MKGHVTDAIWLLVGGEWYPRMLVLHRYMVAISRESLNHDGGGGSGVHLTVWDYGSSRTKTRRVDSRLVEDLAALPGPPGFLDSSLGYRRFWSYY